MSGAVDRLKLEWLPGRYAVCRLDQDAPVPQWAQAGATPRVAPEFTVAANFAEARREDAAARNEDAAARTEDAAARLLSITRTDHELSIVIDQSLIPHDASASMRIEHDFVALRIAGTLDFSEVGILAKLTGALAAAHVPVFVISTFETDVLMVRVHDVSRATKSLSAVVTIVSTR